MINNRQSSSHHFIMTKIRLPCKCLGIVLCLTFHIINYNRKERVGALNFNNFHCPANNRTCSVTLYMYIQTDVPSFEGYKAVSTFFYFCFISTDSLLYRNMCVRIQFVKIIINNALDTNIIWMWQKNERSQKSQKSHNKWRFKEFSVWAFYSGLVFTFTRNKINNAEKISRSNVKSRKKKKTEEEEEEEEEDRYQTKQRHRTYTKERQWIRIRERSWRKKPESKFFSPVEIEL